MKAERVVFDEKDFFVVDGIENRIVETIEHPNCGIVTLIVKDAQDRIMYLPPEDIIIKEFCFNASDNHRDVGECYCANCIISSFRSQFCLVEGDPVSNRLKTSEELVVEGYVGLYYLTFPGEVYGGEINDTGIW